MILVGAAAEPLHGQRLEREVSVGISDVWPTELEVRQYAGDWLSGRYYTVHRICPEPTDRQRRAAAAFEARRDLVQLLKNADLIYVFNCIPVEYPALPEGADVASDGDCRGRVYRWWDEVPAWLMTKTQLRKYGLRPGRTVKAFAHIEYGSGRRYRRYDLYAVSATVPLRSTPAEVRGRLAEEAYWQSIERRKASREWHDEDPDIPF